MLMSRQYIKVAFQYYFAVSGQLKQEIEQNFDIDITDHDVKGSFLRPENDNTILQFCFHSDFNCLTITKLRSRNATLEIDRPVFGKLYLYRIEKYLLSIISRQKICKYKQ